MWPSTPNFERNLSMNPNQIPNQNINNHLGQEYQTPERPQSQNQYNGYCYEFSFTIGLSEDPLNKNIEPQINSSNSKFNNNINESLFKKNMSRSGCGFSPSSEINNNMDYQYHSQYQYSNPCEMYPSNLPPYQNDLARKNLSDLFNNAKNDEFFRSPKISDSPPDGGDIINNSRNNSHSGSGSGSRGQRGGRDIGCFGRGGGYGNLNGMGGGVILQTPNNQIISGGRYYGNNSYGNSSGYINRNRYLNLNNVNNVNNCGGGYSNFGLGGSANNGNINSSGGSHGYFRSNVVGKPAGDIIINNDGKDIGRYSFARRLEFGNHSQPKENLERNKIIIQGSNNPISIINTTITNNNKINKNKIISKENENNQNLINTHQQLKTTKKNKNGNNKENINSNIMQSNNLNTNNSPNDNANNNSDCKISSSLSGSPNELKKQKVLFDVSGSTSAISDNNNKYIGKKRRFRKNNEQLAILTNFYNTHSNWSKKQMKDICNITGLGENKVYKWLWDQRNKGIRNTKFVVNKNEEQP